MKQLIRTLHATWTKFTKMYFNAQVGEELGQLSSRLPDCGPLFTLFLLERDLQRSLGYSVADFACVTAKAAASCNSGCEGMSLQWRIHNPNSCKWAWRIGRHLARGKATFSNARMSSSAIAPLLLHICTGSAQPAELFFVGCGVRCLLLSPQLTEPFWGKPMLAHVQMYILRVWVYGSAGCLPGNHRDRRKVSGLASEARVGNLPEHSERHTCSPKQSVFIGNSLYSLRRQGAVYELSPTP